MYAPFIHISFLAFHFPAIKKPQKQSAYTALIFEKSLMILYHYRSYFYASVSLQFSIVIYKNTF